MKASRSCFKVTVKRSLVIIAVDQAKQYSTFPEYKTYMLVARGNKMIIYNMMS